MEVENTIATDERFSEKEPEKARISGFAGSSV